MFNNITLKLLRKVQFGKGIQFPYNFNKIRFHVFKPNLILTMRQEYFRYQVLSRFFLLRYKKLSYAVNGLYH